MQLCAILREEKMSNFFYIQDKGYSYVDINKSFKLQILLKVDKEAVISSIL